MKKVFTLSIIFILLFFSCKNSGNENQLNQNVEQLQKKEEELKIETKEEKNKIDLKSNIKNNIVHCQNNKFIIRVDLLQNNKIRYASWSKPKTENDKPDLVLKNGKIETERTKNSYIFQNGNWQYIIENIYVAPASNLNGTFLKLLKDGKKKLYTKMKEIKNLEKYDRKSYSIEHLIGNWWTPHFAVRKITFYSNGNFLFNDGNGKSSKGTYAMINRTVEIVFKDGTSKILQIGGGNNGASLTLVGSGENFVKEWNETFQ